MTEKRPANVPQRHANQAAHARYALHARTFFVSGFVSIENKEPKILIPKLDVAGSIPVARSKFQEANLTGSAIWAFASRPSAANCGEIVGDIFPTCLSFTARDSIARRNPSLVACV